MLNQITDFSTDSIDDQLKSLVGRVLDQSKAKRDFLAHTAKALTMLFDPETKELKLLMEGSDGVQELAISDHAHSQICARLGIGAKYYKRLIADHGDMVAYNVNELFNREPEDRLVRVLNNKVRAFLSANYKRVDNNKVLAGMLPKIYDNGLRDLQIVPLSFNVDENNMHIKLLFNDDRLAQEIGTVNGQPDIVKTGFVLKNSETGQGSLSVKGFFYRDYCTNGCHFGGINAVEFSRTHRGARMINGAEYTVLSPETQQAEDDLIWMQATDVIKSLSNPETVQKLGDTIRQANDTTNVKHGDASDVVTNVARELGIREDEKDHVLESFLKDGILNQWGMVNAITEQANNPELVDYDRATELEAIGGKLLDFSPKQWDRLLQVA